MSSEEIDYNTYYDNLYLNDEIVYTRDTSYNFQDTSAEDVLIEIVDQSGGVLSTYLQNSFELFQHCQICVFRSIEGASRIHR